MLIEAICKNWECAMTFYPGLEDSLKCPGCKGVDVYWWTDEANEVSSEAHDGPSEEYTDEEE